MRPLASARVAPVAWTRVLGGAVLALVSAVGVAFLSLPLLALLLRVPLGELGHYLSLPAVRDALRLSAISSSVSLGLMLLFGTPLAYGLGRYQFRGKALLETLLELPLVLPPAVAGVALLFAFGRRTPLGTLLHNWNSDVAFTLAAVVLAQTFVAAPFYIKSARSGFQGVPHELLDAAATQGAGTGATFRHIVVPLAAPSLAGGAILGWARAVGEFGATILFAGNFPARTQTLPLAIYTALEADVNVAIILSALLILTSFTVLLVFKAVSGRALEVTPE
ncbi:MAG: ABC transporter permease [Chloroflexota bacterium]|nr:ABC transporter permease [Chloroflexota bacterium]